MLSANRVDFGLFLFHNSSNFTPQVLLVQVDDIDVKVQAAVAAALKSTAPLARDLVLPIVDEVRGGGE